MKSPAGLFKFFQTLIVSRPIESMRSDIYLVSAIAQVKALVSSILWLAVIEMSSKIIDRLTRKMA